MRPIKRESLHEQITSKLGLAILSGELKEGEISSEIVLCKGLGVSRTILRESLKVLVSKGLLNLRPKVGVSIRPRRDWNLFDPDVLAWQAGAVVDKEFIRTLCEVERSLRRSGHRLSWCHFRCLPQRTAAAAWEHHPLSSAAARQERRHRRHRGKPRATSPGCLSDSEGG